MATHRDPTFYSAQDVGQGGRVIKIRYNPEDNWKVDSDGYLKSPNQIPVSRIESTSSPTVGTGRSALSLDDERLPSDLAMGLERRVVEAITQASDTTGVWGTERGDELRKLADQILQILRTAKYGSATSPDLDRLATDQDLQQAISKILSLLAPADFNGKDAIVALIQQAQNIINQRAS